MTISSSNQESTNSINLDSRSEKRINLKERYPQLTDTELDFAEGKVENMIENIYTKMDQLRKTE